MNETIFRAAAAVILVTGIGISAFFRRRADRESGERISRGVDGPFMALIIKTLGPVLWLGPLAYLANPAWLGWSKIGLPDWPRLTGLGAGLLCLPMIYWMFRSLGSGISPTAATRAEHRLVTKGPYRWVRHPLYTLGTTLFLALGLLADSWFILAAGLVSFAVMAIRTPREEANLIEKFGDQYWDYMRRTGRFFPSLRPRD